MTELSGPKRVLITGAYGLIGHLLYSSLAAQPAAYEPYGLVRDHERSARAAAMDLTEIPAERLRLADISDFEATQRAVAGMEAVVHLAADADGRSGWESVLRHNIIGTHNVFEASHLAGVKRVIFASTNQVVFGYRLDEAYRPFVDGQLDQVELETFQPISHERPTRPLNDYACSKVFGEALAHMYAYSHGLSCLCLRIGWVTPDDRLPYPAAQSLWCSQRDVVQMIERCLNAPDDLQFDVLFVQSDNRYNLVDLAHARQVLGYAPRDRGEDRLANDGANGR